MPIRASFAGSYPFRIRSVKIYWAYSHKNLHRTDRQPVNRSKTDATEASCVFVAVSNRSSGLSGVS